MTQANTSMYWEKHGEQVINNYKKNHTKKGTKNKVHCKSKTNWKHCKPLNGVQTVEL